MTLCSLVTLGLWLSSLPVPCTLAEEADPAAQPKKKKSKRPKGPGVGGLIGEHRQEVAGCQCAGGPTYAGHCGFHDGWFTKAQYTWCRTKHNCGHYDWVARTAWTICDERGVERRRALDGRFYAEPAFEKYYGIVEGVKRWRASKPLTERKYAKNGKALNVKEFRDFCADSLGEEGWLEAWLSADPEMRTAQDGVPYTWESFAEHYGPRRAREEWEKAPLHEGLAGKAASCSEAAAGASEGSCPAEGVEREAPPPTPDAAVAEKPRLQPQSSATLMLLSDKTYPEARCLDGSMAGYYLRPGAATNFLLYLEGGGWCYDSNCKHPTREGTLADCRHRARGRLGSNRYWAPQKGRELSGMLSADPQENPVFHNWTLVYVPYCDGASFSGNTEVDGLHFRGSAILEAVVKELKRSTDIEQASKVLVSGGSAGGSAVFYHVEQIAQQLQLRSGSEVLALPDAGFFVEMRDTKGVSCWPAQMRSLFEVIGYESLHSGCLERFHFNVSKCLFPENFADLLKVRTFAVHSLYDSSEMTYTLGLDCCLNNKCGGSYPKCSMNDMDQVEQLRKRHITTLRSLTEAEGNGAWAPSCVAHVLTSTSSWTDPNWAVPANSNNTMAATVARWVDGVDTDGVGFVHVDSVSYPGNRPCAKSW